MKKIVLSLLFLAATLITVAQTGQRQMVLAEDFTSTLCTYCPGAAMGMDDLLANGKFVAVIAEHSNYGTNDPFKNVYSLARNSMYAVSAYPTVGFDGLKMYCGGNHTTTMYTAYLPLYNYCIGLPSPVDMFMSVSHTGLSYTAIITLTKTDVIPSTSNVLYFFVTQSNVTYNWQGQTHLEHINRLMAPDQNGVPVDFSTGNTQVVTLNFTMDAAWPIADCEFIATLQNKDAGQGNQTGNTSGYPIKAYKVIQTIKQGTIDLSPDFSVTSTDVLINTPVTFTNATSGGYIGVPEEYEWIFPGGTPVSSFDKDPVVSYADSGTYDVTLIVNRGGQIDTLIKTAYMKAHYAVGIQENQTIITTRVSPNPSHGFFTLDVYSGKAVTVNVSVINAINVPVYQESGISFSNRLTKKIDLGNVAKGIYFVVVEQEGNKTVQKVIIN